MEERVDGVVSEEELEVLAGVVSCGGGHGGEWDWLDVFGVEEGAVYLGSHEAFGGDLGGGEEAIV